MAPEGSRAGEIIFDEQADEPPKPAAEPPEPEAKPPKPAAESPESEAEPPESEAEPPKPAAEPPESEAEPPKPAAEPPESEVVLADSEQSETRRELLKKIGERIKKIWNTRKKLLQNFGLPMGLVGLLVHLLKRTGFSVKTFMENLPLALNKAAEDINRVVKAKILGKETDNPSSIGAVDAKKFEEDLKAFGLEGSVGINLTQPPVERPMMEVLSAKYGSGWLIPESPNDKLAQSLQAQLGFTQEELERQIPAWKGNHRIFIKELQAHGANPQLISVLWCVDEVVSKDQTPDTWQDRGEGVKACFVEIEAGTIDEFAPVGTVVNLCEEVGHPFNQPDMLGTVVTAVLEVKCGSVDPGDIARDILGEVQIVPDTRPEMAGLTPSMDSMGLECLLAGLLLIAVAKPRIRTLLLKAKDGLNKALVKIGKRFLEQGADNRDFA